MRSQMFVVTHKKITNIKFPKDYYLISVNKNLKDTDYNDADGVSISYKNAEYCELTALFYIWKNVKNDKLGLSHYRRYFYNLDKKSIYDVDDLNDFLNTGYDIILPKKKKFSINNMKQYEYFHHYGDIKLCFDYIVSTDDTYKKSIDEFLNSKEMYCYNMFYTNRKIFDEYCLWLFDVLFYVEKQINTAKYSSYQKRVFGFLAERLFNVWIIHKGLSIKELNVIFIKDIDNGLEKENVEILDNKICNINFIKYNLKKMLKIFKK